MICRRILQQLFSRQLCRVQSLMKPSIKIGTRASKLALWQANWVQSALNEKFPDQKVVTPILDAAEFFPIQGAEAYHQDYAKNNPVRYNYYRWGCGRDRRLKQIWGDAATH